MKSHLTGNQKEVGGESLKMGHFQTAIGLIFTTCFRLHRTQTLSDNPKEVQIIQTNTAIGVLNLTIPLFIDAYGTLFPELKKLVYSNKDLFLNINVAKGVVGNYKP